MAVQLSSSYLRRSYQLLAELIPSEAGLADTFCRSSDILYQWARRKYANIFRQMPPQAASFSDKRDGNEIGLLYDREGSRFIFRCSHPDMRIPGRMWITDVTISPSGARLLLAVRLSVSSLHNCTEEVPFSRPAFVRTLIEQVGVRDVLPLSAEPHRVADEADARALIRFLEDPDRQLPAVVLTPCYRMEDSRYDGYTMSPEAMARDLVGAAHVFCLSDDANQALTGEVSRSWSAYNGAVRTYYPGVCFEDPTACYQHPLLTLQGMQLRSRGESDDPELCMHEIENSLCSHMLGQRISWEGRGIVFYLAAHQDELQAQRAVSSQSQQELIDSYEEQIAGLQLQCDENLSLADSYSQDCEDYRAQNDQLRETVSQLKAQLASLRYQLEEATGASSQAEIPAEPTYDALPDWISRNYPGRLFLHARAARSLKDALYEDVGLVYRCVQLLATAYYGYCTGTYTREQFLEACRAVDPALDERPAITDTAAGEQGETYFVRYGGRRRKLERHLVKGSNKDRRYCLRIYYFWDDQDQVVVIGDLPHHLDTSAT